MNTAQRLHQAGQALWYDNIQRGLIRSGELAGMIGRGEIRGITSNPSIFMNAIAKTTEYDASLLPLITAGLTDEEIYLQLAVEDIQAAADLFLPLYQESDGADGYISLEVNPFLANDGEATLEQAKELWQLVDRPNLMIKIPATKAGIPAITAALADGIHVNATLIFSCERYAEVMEAYLLGLESRIKMGLPVDSISSVASFFISRIDSKIDQQLESLVHAGTPGTVDAAALQGRAAIANARLAYQSFCKVFDSERFHILREMGARVQRPLWASTSTKNPAYRDVMYVEELIGPDTVNTVPPATLSAFLEHGQVRASLVEEPEQALAVIRQLGELGISMDTITRELELEGVNAFQKAFTELLSAIHRRR